jgi:hypothetical protein
MLNKCLFATIIIIALFSTARSQDSDFGLRQVLDPPPVENGTVVIRVSTKGDAPSSITVPINWTVQLTEGAGQKRSITVTPAAVEFDRFDPKTKRGTNIATLTIPAARFGDLAIDGASWTVLFSDGKYLLAASQADSAPKGLKAAKDRDDADLYGSFSFLTGVGTSPIWVIDAKGGGALTLQHLLHPKTSPKDAIHKSWNRIRTGLFADVQVNTDTKAPVDRTQIDPNSIRAFWKVFGTHRIGHRLYSMYWEVQPAGGEFNHSNPSSNFVGGGKVQFVTLPFDNAPLDFNPQFGIEIGKNLNKPSVLFDHPVDLSHYDAIRRFVTGADADLYKFRKQIKDPDDPYLVTVSGSYVARILFSPEPFTVSTLVVDSTTGKPARQKVVSMRQNTRHNVSADINWNATKLLGLQLGYKFGSLPPLFEFVDHQVTIGLVFKAKFAKWHSVQ